MNCETALAIKPDSAITRAFYGWYLVSIGETEAGLAEARRGAEAVTARSDAGALAPAASPS